MLNVVGGSTAATWHRSAFEYRFLITASVLDGDVEYSVWSSPMQLLRSAQLYWHASASSFVCAR